MSRARSTSCRSGVSLIEAILTVFLVSLVFWVAADLLHNAGRAVRFGNAKSRSMQAIQLGLQRMANEAREAYSLEATGTELRLLKVDPAPGRVPTPAPASWAPHDLALRVRYSTDGQNRLWREVGPLAGTPSPQLIAEGVSGFSSRVLPNGNLELSVSLSEDGQVRTYTTQVLMMAAP